MTKILLSIILLILPFSVFAEWICLSPIGCAINIETGECPNCVWEEDKPLKVFKEPKETPVREFVEPIVEIPKSFCSRKWERIVPPCDDMIDEHGCLIGD